MLQEHAKHTHTRQLIVLGSTGSIGVNTLQVVQHLNDQTDLHIQVVGLAAGRKADLLIEQARTFGVGAVALADATQADKVHHALPHVQLFVGQDAAKELVQHVQATDLCAAMVGSAGLPATLVAIEKGMRIALANKETLVAAGQLVCPLVKKHNATLLPVDSEHSAIFQCMHRDPAKAIKRIVLTASGGPFRQMPKEQMENATVEQALNHPTWNMGPKISIDSATMMNKALEIIEAHWLFDMTADQIQVVIHPQSIVHSFVEFADNSVLAQLGPPDMKTPIQYALTYPDRLPGCSASLDWSTLSTLDFFQPDFDKFASLKLAFEVVKAGGTAGAIFNAANEAAVAAFLEQKIPFGRITPLAGQALDHIEVKPIDCDLGLEFVLDADRQARNWVDQNISQYA